VILMENVNGSNVWKRRLKKKIRQENRPRVRR
jgi:hypothetical protein